MSEVAYFGMGCFWKPQFLFSKIRGVVKTEVGFMGGVAEASYEEVCAGGTGHVEVVKVEFDPAVVGYRELLKVFWENHDPTQQDGQGVDVGEQYLSRIFVSGSEQEAEAQESLKETEEKLGEVVATKIEPAGEFFKAEEYHQDYLKKGGSCGF